MINAARCCNGCGIVTLLGREAAGVVWVLIVGMSFLVVCGGWELSEMLGPISAFFGLLGTILTFLTQLILLPRTTFWERSGLRVVAGAGVGLGCGIGLKGVGRYIWDGSCSNCPS